MLFRKSYVLLALTSICRAAISQQQQPILSENAVSKTYLDDELDTFVEGILQQYHVPGMSLAVVDGGDIFSRV